VKALTSAATTNNQYLILFIPTILPQPHQLSSPLTFSHFFLVVLTRHGIVYTRSADSQGRGPAHALITL
jgi:hypothetical protein